MTNMSHVERFFCFFGGAATTAAEAPVVSGSVVSERESPGSPVPGDGGPAGDVDSIFRRLEELSRGIGFLGRRADVRWRERVCVRVRVSVSE